MGKTKKVKRSAKAAKKKLKSIARPNLRKSDKSNESVRPRQESIEGTETTAADARMVRFEETRKRNAAGQELPANVKKRRKDGPRICTSQTESLDADKQAFFAAIDEPLTRVCGSCGELANSTQAVLKKYHAEDKFLKPLRNDSGLVEIIEEGLVPGPTNVKSLIWFCGRCYRALCKHKTPKFSRASGFRVHAVPEELAVVNRIEARLIGLGISFTTCVNLYRDRQEFTRGNAINYWNNPGEVVRELPRPLKSCGVVFLAAQSEKSTKYFRVRPDIVRVALCWLISNNPLYKDIQISERNLRALEVIDVERDIPTIPVTDEEVLELRGQLQQINDKEGLANKPATSSSMSPSAVTDCSKTCYTDEPNGSHTMGDVQQVAQDDPPTATEGKDVPSELYTETTLSGTALPSEVWNPVRPSCSTCNTNFSRKCLACENTALQPCSSCSGTLCQFCRNPFEQTKHGLSSASYNAFSSNDHDAMNDLTESFELEGIPNGKQSELEHIMKAAGVDNTNYDYPIGELRCCGDPIDEYRTQHLMQTCFPTLFPDGHGGFHPLQNSEDRMHEYTLTEFCAHLMKWHDIRYVIHGNFKFFCMNLIQRRQVDGLVRRVTSTENRSAAISTLTADHESCTNSRDDNNSFNKEELSAAMQVLNSLKPYFRVVRGSGLYWSNARDDLMAMIGNRSLPTRWPTFFLTLSAADTIWPDFFRACNPSLSLDQCRRLSFSERRKYLNENPDISARYFSRRFKAFFDNVLCGKAKPFR